MAQGGNVPPARSADADGGADRHPDQPDLGERARVQQAAQLVRAQRHLPPSRGRTPAPVGGCTPASSRCPAFVNMNLERHVRSHYELFFDLVNGDVGGAEAKKTFYDEYFAVLDMAAEFYLETVQRVFQEHQLARGVLEYHGQRVDPAAIRRIVAAHRRGRARRHLLGRPDPRGPRPVHRDPRRAQASPPAAGRRPLRRLQRSPLGHADLSRSSATSSRRATDTDHAQRASSGSATIASIASGFASASAFRTGLPCTASATASSTSLLLRVRGRSSTAATTAGTWRGEHSERTRWRISATSSSVSVSAVGETNEQHDPEVVLPLADRTRAPRARRASTRRRGRSRRCRSVRRPG